MTPRRDPEHAHRHRGMCYRCKRPIRLGADQIIAYDGVTFHVECPVYPPARLSGERLSRA